MPSLPQTESENSEKSIQHIVMEACFSSVAFGRQGLTCHRGSYVASQTLLSVIREGIWGSENPFVLDRMGVRYKWTEMERLVAHSQPTVEGKPWVFLWVFFFLSFFLQSVWERGSRTVAINKSLQHSSYHCSKFILREILCCLSVNTEEGQAGKRTAAWNLLHKHEAPLMIKWSKWYD